MSLGQSSSSYSGTEMERTREVKEGVQTVNKRRKRNMEGTLSFG